MADEHGLTTSGREFEDAYWIYDDGPAARAVWQDALLRLRVTQALMQSFHGRGAVRFAGLHYSLARHDLAGTNDTTLVRTMLQVLNAAGIVAYSNKLQTIRIVAPIPEDIAAVVRVVEPERPYSNVLALRETLRDCEDYIHWAEPHLPGKALEPLSYVADGAVIKEIKLLSDERWMHDTARRDFKRFAAEMKHRGINAEWRVIPPGELDWHDRFILGARQAWNVPPVNTVHKGSYSEISRTPTPPPFDEWWELGTPLLK